MSFDVSRLRLSQCAHPLAQIRWTSVSWKAAAHEECKECAEGKRLKEFERMIN